MITFSGCPFRVGEPLLVNGMRDRRTRMDRVAELLWFVGLKPEYLRRFPNAFSGGQRQRIGIARALSLNPRLIVADEPVSALDVSVQAQILNLLLDLKGHLHLTYAFVAHNLGVVKHVCDRVAVMFVGKLVELAGSGTIYRIPRHSYTAAPVADQRVASGTEELPGEVPSPAKPPPGCTFHPRCAQAVDRCREEPPGLRECEPGHLVSCHRADELTLRDIA